MFDQKDNGERRKEDQKYPDQYQGTRPDFATGKTVGELLREALEKQQGKK